MSGFGNLPQSASFGGFGSNNSSNNTFGAPHNQNAAAFPPQPFGNVAQPPMNMPYGVPAATQSPMAQPAGFGQPQSSQQQQPFGGFVPQQQQQQPTMTFGKSPNVAVPPPTTSFGGNAPPFGSTSASRHPFGGGSGAASNAGPFGAPVAAAPTTTSVGPFGSPPAAASGPFGGGPFAAAPAGPFGAPPSAGPFSNNTNAGPSISFGAPKTMASTPAPSSNADPFGSPNATNAGPFAAAQSSSSAGFSSQPSFGDPSGFGTGMASDPASGSSNPFGRKKKTPRPKPAITPFGPPPAASASNDASDDGMTDADASAEKALAEMKAKIAAKREKMRKLQERKNKAKSDDEDNDNDGDRKKPATNPFAARSNSPRPSRNASPVPPARSQLPRDLQNAPPVSASTSASYPVPSTDRENLEDAVALVGLCQHMCPDEEMMRREAESDVQLLERPETTSIHPADWTLRDTMIKRFRRSAADFKLDVPEWVRPPDVLERVCGYLEEWIMDRDRQGPDPRFKNSTPLPLDVYQFVWDRTRMVRKDFILQNYVGGARGLCDARAVRCHERIARWHCMCEHQLSHIEEFVTKQSQQNIQELGQTIKSLNQFYDDTLDRALLEVPDADGNETRTDLSNCSHGCKADVVQGKDPVDYDGSPLVNADDRRAARRLIGVVSEPHRGTAEPEMRGLYILQTMNNDGGMEVRKFVSNLSQNRPEIFRSYPVQLALAIFKATKANNYIKFFSILRNDATPYLFSCLMFKHVQFMRRAAIKMFSSTYGGRGPDGKVTADDYPLKRLRILLCFEDEEEAFLACKHFNITVTKRTDKKGKERYIILWRQTEFREPIDAAKGTIVPLQPRKMIKTIEKKLHGASRLAVCRGQVSGKGACLAPRQLARMSQRSQQPSTTTQPPSQLRTAAEAQLRTREAHAQRIEEEAKKSEEEAKKKATEEAKKKKLMEEEEAKRRSEQEEQAKLSAEKQKEEEEKLRRKQTEEQEQEKRRIEAENKAKEEAAQKAQQAKERQAQAERQRLARIEEEKRKEEERKRAHIEDLRRQEEEANLRREKEAERLRLQAQKEREETLKAKEEARKRADEARRIRMEEERKKVQEINRRVTNAKRKLSFYLLLSRTRYVRPKRSTTKYVPTSPKRGWFDSYGHEQNLPQNELIHVLRSAHSEQSRSFQSTVMAHFVEALVEENQPSSSTNGCPMLLRIGIFYHPAEAESDHADVKAAYHWISSRIVFNKVLDCHPLLRLVFFDGQLQPKPNICNGAILITPYGRPTTDGDVENQLNTMLVSLSKDIPCAVLNLNQRPSCGPESGKIRDATIFENERLDLASIDAALTDSMRALARIASRESQPEVERISAGRFYYECARRAVWHNDTNDDEENFLISAIHFTVGKAIRHFHEICQKLVSDEMAWPPTEFSDNGSVHNYFATGEHLPLNWLSLSLSKHTKSDILAYTILLNDESLRTTLDLMTTDAPISTREKVLDLLDRRKFRGAVEKALLWRADRDEERGSCAYIYLPAGSMTEVLDVALAQLHSDPSSPHEQLVDDVEADQSDYYQTIESVSDFAEEITLPPGQPPVADSPKKRVRRADVGGPDQAKSQSRGRPTKKAKQEKESSKRVKASADFSRQLEELVNGGTVNMLIGKDGSTLKGLLHRAPKIQTDF